MPKPYGSVWNIAIKLQQSFIARIVQDGAVAGVEIARKFLEVAPRLSAEELATLDTLVAGLSQRPEIRDKEVAIVARIRNYRRGFLGAKKRVEDACCESACQIIQRRIS